MGKTNVTIAPEKLTFSGRIEPISDISCVAMLTHRTAAIGILPIFYSYPCFQAQENAYWRPPIDGA